MSANNNRIDSLSEVIVLLTDRIKILGEEVGTLNEAAQSQMKSFEYSQTIKSYDDTVKRASQRLMKNIGDRIKATRNGISVDTSDIAVYFIIQLWEELTELQRYLKKSSNFSIVVNITHSVDIEFWKREDAAGSLQDQKNFVRAGGTINRIIQGSYELTHIKNPLPAKIEDPKWANLYKSVINDMVEHGINVSYVQRITNNPKLDFAVINMPPLTKHKDMAMIWYLDQAEVIKCDVIMGKDSTSNGQDIGRFKVKWQELASSVVEKGHTWEGKREDDDKEQQFG